MVQDEFEAPHAALREHLREVRPIFDAFCDRHGFANVDPQRLGRYPRIRIERSGSTNLWFELWMDLDKNGRRFERFRRDLPYELSAGAYIEVDPGTGSTIRFYKFILCFRGKPFEQIGAILESEMERFLPTLEGWDAEYLAKTGAQVQLDAYNPNFRDPTALP